jgi:hypothetical protein
LGVTRRGRQRAGERRGRRSVGGRLQTLVPFDPGGGWDGSEDGTIGGPCCKLEATGAGCSRTGAHDGGLRGTLPGGKAAGALAGTLLYRSRKVLVEHSASVPAVVHKDGHRQSSRRGMGDCDRTPLRPRARLLDWRGIRNRAGEITGVAFSKNLQPRSATPAAKWVPSSGGARDSGSLERDRGVRTCPRVELGWCPSSSQELVSCNGSMLPELRTELWIWS